MHMRRSNVAVDEHMNIHAHGIAKWMQESEEVLHCCRDKTITPTIPQEHERESKTTIKPSRTRANYRD